ncbi:MAG: hypothetical protein V3V14_13765 [Saprospiraceae bacterium]
MKPVFQEDNFKRLKRLIEEVNPSNKEVNVQALVDDVETSLKAYQDNNENRLLLYGSSMLLVALAILLLVMSKASWPIMFLIVWLGAFMYYRVHEKGMINEYLSLKALITPSDPIPKINYLQSVIDLKLGRKSLLKVLLSVFVPASAMLLQTLLVEDASFTMNFALLIGMAIVSYFFWNNFYKEDLSLLEKMKEQLQELKSKVILDRSYDREEKNKCERRRGAI